MFLRSTRRKKDGKDHRYFSIVESHRLSSGKMAQRTVLYSTVDGRWLILPRYTQPEKDTKILLQKLKLELPTQPPPRITANFSAAEAAS
jgi:hypothetical protein